MAEPQEACAPRIALLTAGMDRHARELLDAFRRVGAQVHAMKLSEIGFDTGARHGLRLPVFGEALPDAVCLRTMDGGTFEAVTRRLGILHALDRLGILVSNGPRAVENCTDKSMTSFLLRAAGLPSPRSYAIESRREAERIVSAEDGPLVLKPLFGAQGKGLRLIRSTEDLPAGEEIAGVYYLQRYAGSAGATRHADLRYLVSAGRVVAAMRRESEHWITNIKQGATGIAVEPEAEMTALALGAAAAVGADFCGVDLLRDASGKAQLIEVNSMPAWSGLRRATGIDIAAIRAGDLMARLAGGSARPLRRIAS